MALTASELEPLLRLALVPGVGPHRLAHLVNRFGSPGAAMAASDRELTSVRGVGRELSARIRAAGGERSSRETRRAMLLLDRLGAVALSPDDPSYPPRFLDLADPPYLVFAIGDLSLVQKPAVAVVGTRTPTPYGRRTATALAHDLALAGLVVISGLARGIDAAAHQGALEAKGATIGVLGHGIEQIYPPEARPLFERVRRQGLVITEYPPGETPRAGNFPRRNRLITALSQGVVVVEMGHRSGAQHTVGFALEQGREVFAVPGPIGTAASEGTNQLIKDGARMVTGAQDVLEELFGVGWEAGESAAGRLSSPAPVPYNSRRESILQLLDAKEERVFRAVGDAATHVDEVARASGLEVSEALASLLELELRGLVSSGPGMRFSRA